MTLSLQFQVWKAQQRLNIHCKLKSHRDPTSIKTDAREPKETPSVYFNANERICLCVFVCVDDCVFSLAEVDWVCTGCLYHFQNVWSKKNCLFIFGVRKMWKEREVQRTDAGKIRAMISPGLLSTLESFHRYVPCLTSHLTKIPSLVLSKAWHQLNA